MTEFCPNCDAPLRPSKHGGSSICRRCILQTVDPITPAEKKSAAQDYEMIREIGRGSVGTIYLAKEKRTGREVALKLFNATLNPEDSSGQRFLNEIEIISSLEHPAIAPVYGNGEIEGRPFYTMKYFSGGTLAEKMMDFATPEKAVALLVSVAEAVHFAHTKGRLHRDLKPDNILLDQQGNPHLSDFGLAKRTQGSQLLTLTGTVIGTPAYMSPEQAAGRTQEITTLSDLCSLGMIFFHLLTGRQPFEGSSHNAVIESICHQEPTFTKQDKKTIPPNLIAICQKAIAKNPAERYSSVAQFVGDLKHHQKGEPLIARPPGKIASSLRWIKTHPVATLFIATLFAAFIAINSETIQSLESSIIEMVFKSQSAEYTYRFDHSMEGWKNVQTVEINGMSGIGFIPKLAQEYIEGQYRGDGALVNDHFPDYRDAPQSRALWARSPSFTISAHSPIEIAFCLGGGMNTDSTPPTHDHDPRLQQPSIEKGWMGLVLRRESDGAFLLFSNKYNNSEPTAHSSLWTWPEIQAATVNDSPDESYTFDLIDLGHDYFRWTALFHLNIHELE